MLEHGLTPQDEAYLGQYKCEVEEALGEAITAVFEAHEPDPVRAIGKQLVSARARAKSAPEPSAIVLCGPVIGTVTSTTANVLLEVDEDGVFGCVATPLEGSAPVCRASSQLKADVPGIFVLNDLTPGCCYSIAFEGLALAQNEESDRLGCVIRTLPAKIEQLRMVAVSCDYPSRLPENEG